MTKCQRNEKHYNNMYNVVCSLLYVNFQRDSSSLQQVFNKCTLRQTDFQDFQNFLGQHPIFPVQEWVTYFGTFPHMAALFVTKMSASTGLEFRKKSLGPAGS